MLETFTQTTFTPHLGTLFHLALPDLPGLSLELLTVTAWQSQTADTVQAPQRRTPFSVLFRGPLTPILPQRMYTLEHAPLAACRREHGLLPIGPLVLKD